MALTDFVDQLNTPGASSFSVLASSSFPSLADFNASAMSEALKWTDLEQNTVYQIVSTCTVNTQHGQSVVLSLQKADGSCFFFGMWYVDERVAAKPYGDGELAVICVHNYYSVDYL